MRLGVVLTGTGVHAAAGAGVLCELWRRQMEPYAVCGIGAGAWPAALFAAGVDAAQMEEAAALAQRMGVRMLRPKRGFAKGRADSVYACPGMERLLAAQTGGRILALCPRRAVIPVRMARQERDVAFATQSFAPGRGEMLVMQASAAFAARAAMGLAPFLTPTVWMGKPLLPTADIQTGISLLTDMGAQRVLVVEAEPPPRHEMDALETAALPLCRSKGSLAEGTARLCVMLPEQVGALSFSQIMPCMAAGKRAAERELDRILEEMGLAACRVLPFRRLPV